MILPAGIRGDLERDEGWRATPYRDSRGLLTVGHGFLIEPGQATPMPRAVGDLWLDVLIAERAAALDAEIPWWRDLDTVRQRVLLNMAYQLGVAGLLRFRNTLAAVRSGNYTGAALGMLDSLWARQTPARARRLAEAMRTGTMPR
jgi:lysozyme